MAWPDAVAEILRQYASPVAERLGGGDEAEVYALDRARIIRLYKEQPDREVAQRRQTFYATLVSTHVPFRVPVILDADARNGLYFTVEERIPGISLADALPRLDGAARHRALRGYAETSLAVRRIAFSQQSFGEVLAPSPIRCDTWAEFVLSRARQCLDARMSSIAGEVDDVEKAMRRLQDLLAQFPCSRPDLVHGDFYPANVLTDADGRVTGLIDFGALTVMGDPRMDAAGAVLYLAGMDSVTAEDKRIVADCVKEHGIDEAVLDLYRIFYAFRFLMTDRAVVLRWCVETLQWAAGQSSPRQRRE